MIGDGGLSGQVVFGVGMGDGQLRDRYGSRGVGGDNRWG